MSLELPLDYLPPSELTAGVDEVGRGPLAGPVVAAAVILDPRQPIEGLRDSKTLSVAERERLASEIKAKARGWSLGRAEVAEIDRLNILRATMLAMERAVLALWPAPDVVLVDGNQRPFLACATVGVIGGDAQVEAISAASILAKVARDREMSFFDATFPGYGFTHHKGYATRAHLDALDMLGPSAIHRTSFAPVRQAQGSPVRQTRGNPGHAMETEGAEAIQSHQSSGDLFHPQA